MARKRTKKTPNSEDRKQIENWHIRIGCWTGVFRQCSCCGLWVGGAENLPQTCHLIWVNTTISISFWVHCPPVPPSVTLVTSWFLARKHDQHYFISQCGDFLLQAILGIYVKLAHWMNDTKYCKVYYKDNNNILYMVKNLYSISSYLATWIWSK